VFDCKRKSSDDPAYGKLEKQPTYAKTLGIEATGAVNNQNMESDPKGLRSSGGLLCSLRGERKDKGFMR